MDAHAIRSKSIMIRGVPVVVLALSSVAVAQAPLPESDSSLPTLSADKPGGAPQTTDPPPLPTTPADKAVDDASFPLLSHGLVVGAGFGMHSPTPSVDDELRDVATTPIAYVGYMFGYWGSGREETDAFCASFQGANAIRRADSTAIAMTALAKMRDAQAMPEGPDKQAKLEQAQSLASKTSMYLVRDEIADIRKIRKWDIGTPARCGWRRKLGIFVGRPLQFKADVEAPDGTGVLAEVSSIATVGIIVSPKPYIQILLGVTFAHAAFTVRLDPQTTRTTNDRIYMPFLGIGTPLDALGGVFK